MKKFTSFFALLVLSATVLANPIEPEKALEVATSFWRSNAPKEKKSNILRLSTDNLMSKSGSRDNAEKIKAQYYLFTSDNDKSFVIVSGDDRLSPIVGYSFGNCNGEMPPALVEWLNEYSSYVDDVRTGKITPSQTTATGTSIAPMLKTSWNQSAPYNNYCPEVSGSRTPTGCTATATAQVMRFHEWPATPKKDITWESNITGEKEEIKLTSRTYNWNLMLNHYRNGYTREQADAVAQLMVDVGKAIKSSYGLSGTGSSDIYAAEALVKVFDYSPQIKIVNRSEYTCDEFIALIRENLEARQPLVHCGHGQSYAAGHAFVCDGIDENNLLHIDWGWDGAYNGYFDIGSMAPGGTGIGGGQERYNVGQSIITNIRPRKANESDRAGDPTIFVFEVTDPANNNEAVEEHTLPFTGGTATFQTLVQFLNWSHSPVRMYYGFCITGIDNTYSKLMLNKELETIAFENASGYYYPLNISNSPANGDYLAPGKYNIEIYYKNINGTPQKMRGENNRLILEVKAGSATLKKALPEIELTALQFRKKPVDQNDEMSFDVALTNKNDNNASVLVVPIVNYVGNGTVKSDTLASYGALIDILDGTDFLATFSVKKMFANSGSHYISFAYEMRNSYTNHDTNADKKKLKSIAGKSETFEIEALPEGAMPTVKAISANNPVFGKTLTLGVRIANESGSGTPYTGTIGIFVEKDGKKSLLARGDIESLDAGATTVMQYSSNSYAFIIDAGIYEVYACEQSDGEWKRISHDGYYSLQLQEPTNSLLYTNSRININNGNAVKQGDSIDVIVSTSCKAGDLDGYIRMNVINGLKMVLRSEYIPITIKDGETIDVNLRSKCAQDAKLGEWNVNIIYYDKNKRELGKLLINDITYPDNGVFYIQEATGIGETELGTIEVSSGNGAIAVKNAPEGTEMTISSTGGKIVYRGSASSVQVEKGIYIVAIGNTPDSKHVVKVLVK